VWLPCTHPTRSVPTRRPAGLREADQKERYPEDVSQQSRNSSEAILPLTGSPEESTLLSMMHLLTMHHRQYQLEKIGGKWAPNGEAIPKSCCP
jgi:hypothetical protein